MMSFPLTSKVLALTLFRIIPQTTFPEPSITLFLTSNKLRSGESLIATEGGQNRLKTLYEFTVEYKNSETGILELFKPLRDLLENTGPKYNRQRILQFGIIIHALIDHFDPKHKVIRKRDSYANKLTDKTRKSLQNRIFKHYIPFVMHHNKYYLKEEGPPGVSPK